ncbi:MAG: hypothetical protein PHR68_04770 [Candidatus Gracilibacteria bacterium]|nr:hypothetical protein [Candidatus Gracilibacteria bacterium]
MKKNNILFKKDLENIKNLLVNDLSNQEFNKKTDLILNFSDVSILDFLNSINSPLNMEDFVEFKKILNKKICDIFSSFFVDEDKNFKMTFEFSDLNFFIGNSDKKEYMRKLLVKKHEIFSLIFLVSIKEGKLDKIFSEDEKNTLSSLIESKIFKYFNELLISWQKSEEYFHEGKNKKYIKLPNLSYSGLVDGKLTAYKDILSPDFVNGDKLGDLKINEFDKYFNNYFIKFINSGIIPFKKWLDAEHLSIDSWENKDSNLCFSVPIETYQRHNVLVDLELEVFMKNEDNEYKNLASSLSENYFDSDFDISNIKFFIVEPILSSGVVITKGILGKSFPNNPQITEERGTFIYSIKSRFGEELLLKSKSLYEKFGLKDVDEKMFAKNSIEHVAFHEYGHSLFIKGNRNTQLEETKASLFYDLYLYEKNKEKTFNQNEIAELLKFFFIEILRKLKNLGNSALNQYIIREKIILNLLLKNDLIFWNNDESIGFDPDSKKFTKFLEELKDLLFKIKEIYSDENGKDEESKILMNLEEDIEEEAVNIFNRINGQK